ncbi:MAG: hypothetical protein GEV09_01820 [Pseudonocardiaceae bacterium]|nr:hypothetical protein [Pseudonocardiaceae bacterium]
MLLVVKSTIAAVVSWAVANQLGMSSATFAPFSALLVVQSTVPSDPMPATTFERGSHLGSPSSAPRSQLQAGYEVLLKS